MENIIEEWKELPDAKGYFISNLGRAKITRSKNIQTDVLRDMANFIRIKMAIQDYRIGIIMVNVAE